MSETPLYPINIQVADKARNIRFDSKKFAKSIFSASTAAVDGDYGTAMKTIYDQGLKSDELEDIAFNLLYAALAKAAMKITQSEEYKIYQTFLRVQPENASKLEVLVEKLIEKQDWEIGKSFFHFPHKHPLLLGFKQTYLEWLKLVKFHQPEKIVARLPVMFAGAVNYEIKHNRNQYIPLLNYFFSNEAREGQENAEREDDYKRELAAYYNSPALGDEVVLLSDIYVKPGILIHRDCFRKEAPGNNPLLKVTSHTSIHNFIHNDFLQGRNSLEFETHKPTCQSPKLLVLLGQPGQGKTSFCYRTLNHLLDETSDFNRDVYFLKLRDLEEREDFIHHPLDTVSEQIKKSCPCHLENALVILDGLDELYMSKGLSDMNIDQILSKLVAGAKQHNGLQIIITSRTMYVKNTKAIPKNDALILHLDYLSNKQQKEWLRTYKTYYKQTQLTEDKLDEINESQNQQSKSIKELINQPILLHLIAKADFDIQLSDNRSKIYESLFDKFTEREQEKRQTKFQNLEPEDLRRLLRAIAFAIYKSPNEYITFEELAKNDELLVFIENNNIQGTGEQQINDVLKEVLINFYFQAAENTSQLQGKNAIEFLHKSLHEYLAAEHVWHFIYDSFLDKKEKRKNLFILNTWEKALETWHRELNIEQWSKEFLGYYYDIITQDEREKSILFDRMNKFFPDFLEKQFLWEYRAEQSSKPMNHASSGFFLFWQTLQLVNQNKDNIIKGDLKSGMSYMVKTIISYYAILLSNQNLISADLRSADLRSADLSSAVLRDADLRDADLRSADLRSADLRSADLRDAVLRSAVLRDADLISAVLISADLRSADLRSAVLRSAVLRDADLSSTVLRSADLRDADLRSAVLISADLRSAVLISADLRSAVLISAVLISAVLRSADLRSADLSSAVLSSADLRDAKGLHIDQLKSTKTLYQCQGIPLEMEKELKQTHPHLFENPYR